MSEQLGTVKKVELRSIWEHEARNFTQWLSQNLELLGEAVGIDIELIQTESPVGDFKVDIFAKEMRTTDIDDANETERKIIIENQLEDTDHDHLGKIITYAAGKEAEVIIWIVAHARDEHRSAIEWLNQNTNEDISFFLIEIELWSIDDSKPAPRFNIIERPNYWEKIVKASQAEKGVGQFQFRYWSLYEELASENIAFKNAGLNPQRARIKGSSDISVGIASIRIRLSVAYKKNEIAVGLFIPDDKELGAEAESKKDQFAKIVGVKPDPFDYPKAFVLRFYRYNCDLHDETQWPDFIQWQIEKAVLVRKAIDELLLKNNDNN